MRIKLKKVVKDIKEKLDNLTFSEEVKKYKNEEEKIQLTAELILKTYNYCKALAEENYASMLKEEICNPKTSQKGLQKELSELKTI